LFQVFLPQPAFISSITPSSPILDCNWKDAAVIAMSDKLPQLPLLEFHTPPPQPNSGKAFETPIEDCNSIPDT